MNNRDTPVYQYGTTVRFESQFFDFNGDPAEPDSVTLKIYNYKYAEIHTAEGMQVTGIKGKFFYDYETEWKEQRLFYEWYAEVDGTPSLKRGEFMTRFV